MTDTAAVPPATPPRRSLASFFIRRPIFAIVLAIAAMLAGALGLVSLSISQYPQIAPTTVRIGASYPGASADAVENSVTTTIETGMTGLDGLLYMESSSSTGSASVTLTFSNEVDPNYAQVEVQNKLSLVTKKLPAPVQTAGLTVSRSTSSILMIGNIVSMDGRYSTNQLSDIMTNQIQTKIEQVDGVGSIQQFGAGYAMRIWLDPAVARKIPAHHSGCRDRHPAAEHPGFGRLDRLVADGQGPAIAGRGDGAEPATDARPVQGHHLLKFAADGLDGAARRCVTRRARAHHLWREFDLQRPSRRRLRRPTGERRQRHLDRQWRARRAR